MSGSDGPPEKKRRTEPPRNYHHPEQEDFWYDVATGQYMSISAHQRRMAQGHSPVARAQATEGVVNELLAQMQDRFAVTYQPEQRVTLENVNLACLGRYSQRGVISQLNPLNWLPSRREQDLKESLDRRNADEAKIKTERDQIRTRALESTEKRIRQIQEQGEKEMRAVVDTNTEQAVKELEAKPNPPK